MLAPLKDRSLIEQEPAVSLEQRIAQLEAANAEENPPGTTYLGSTSVC